MKGLKSENRGFRKRDVDPLRNPRKTKKKKERCGFTGFTNGERKTNRGGKRSKQRR